MNLTDRLLNPETVEAELKWVESSGKVGIPCEEVAMTYPRAIAEMADAISELHERLKTAKADLARKDRTIIALEEIRRQTEYVHSEQIKEKEILAYDTGKELEAALVALATAKAEGAAEELAALVNNQTIHAESGSILVNAADLEPQAWINVRVIRDRAAEIRKQVQG